MNNRYFLVLFTLFLFILVIGFVGSQDAPPTPPTIQRTATTDTICEDYIETTEICYTDYCVDYDTYENGTEYCLDLRANYCRNNSITKQRCSKTLYSGIMNYDNGSEFLPVDTTVFNSSYLTYDYEMIKAPYKAYFEDNINTGEAVRFEKDGYYFIYDLSGGKMQWVEQEGNPTKTKSIGSISSSSPNIMGNTIVYNDSFLDTDVQYYLYNTMLKENFILNSLTLDPTYLFLEYQGEVRFSNNLSMYVNGVNVTKDEFQTQNRIELRDISNQTVFYLPEPTVEDNESIYYGYYNVKPNVDKFTFGLRVNVSQLETMNFPVVIDPTVQLQDADSQNLGDSWLEQSNKDGGAYGNDTTIDIYMDDNGFEDVGIFRFNISQILSEQGISSSSLCILLKSSGIDEGESYWIDSKRDQSNNWTEASVTWDELGWGSSEPSNVGSAEKSLYFTNTNSTDWYCWETTSIVNTSYQNNENNVSIVLDPRDAGGTPSSFDVLSFYSKEESDTTRRPYLNITYVEPSSAISDCTILNIANHQYNLTADITDSSTSNCMDITANNVTLDCQGHTIDGNDFADYGLRAQNAGNITIKNCNVSDWDTSAVYLYNSKDNILDNSTFVSIPNIAIYAVLTNTTTIKNNTIYNSQDGIDGYKSNLNLIDNNISSSDWDITFSYISDISHCNWSVINTYNTDARKIEFINKPSSLDSWNNNVSEIVVCSDNVSINNLTLTRTDTRNDGLFVAYSDNLNVTSSTFEGTENWISWAIESETYTQNIYIAHNTFNNSDKNGIYIEPQLQNTVEIFNNSFYDADGNEVYYRSSGLILHYNKFLGVGSYPISLFSGATNNSIYNNIFNKSGTASQYINAVESNNYFNTSNKTLGTNIYNSLNPYIGGNFYTNKSGNGYSDNCSDSDFDGFCDDAYNLGPGYLDYLPLSTAFDSSPPTYNNHNNNATSNSRNSTIVEFTANLSDAGVGLDYYIFAHNLSGILTNQTPVDISGKNFVANETITINWTRGNIISAQFWFNDSNGFINMTNLSLFTVANTPPVMGAVTLNNTKAFDFDDLNATGTAYDADSDSYTEECYWYNNTQLIEGIGTNCILTSGNLSKNSYIFVNKSVTDSYDYSLNVTSGGITIPILNLSTPWIKPATAYTNNPLNCSFQANETNATHIEYNITWFNETEIIQSEKNTCVNGEICSNGLAYPLTQHFFNYTCQVKANTTISDLSAINSTEKYIENTAPVMGGVTISPDPANDAADLTCVGTATDIDPEDTLSYQCFWYKDTVLQADNECTRGNADTGAGEDWQCKKMANDSNLWSANQTSQTVTIDSSNSAPQINWTAAYTINTGYINNTINVPTFNNSGINFSVNHTEHDEDEVTLFICDSSSASANGCDDFEYCRSNVNTTDNPITCEFTEKNYTSVSNTYYAILMDNTSSLSASESWNFYINFPPDDPTISSPKNNSIQDTDSASLVYSSSDDDTIYYQVYGGNIPNPTTLLVNTSSSPYAWSSFSTGYKYWFVQAIDSFGYESIANSSIFNFYYYEVPEINGSVVYKENTLEIPTSGNKVKEETGLNFSINFTEHDAQKTTLFVCNSSNITKLGCGDWEFCRSPINISDNPISCLFDDLNYTDEEDTYYSFVMDNESNISSSNSGTFYVNFKPTTPTLSNPINAQSYSSGTTTVLLNWTSSTDENSGDTLRYLAYGNTSNPPDTLKTNQTTTQYIWSSLGAGTYFWRVGAVDQLGYQANSTTYFFTIASATSPGGGGGLDESISEEDIQEILAGQPKCGDGTCGDGESPFNCPEDCAPLVGWSIDDLTNCFWGAPTDRCLLTEAGFFSIALIGIFIIIIITVFVRSGGYEKLQKTTKRYFKRLR